MLTGGGLYDDMKIPQIPVVAATGALRVSDGVHKYFLCWVGDEESYLWLLIVY